MKIRNFWKLRQLVFHPLMWSSKILKCTFSVSVYFLYLRAWSNKSTCKLSWWSWWCDIMQTLSALLAFLTPGPQAEGVLSLFASVCPHNDLRNIFQVLLEHGRNIMCRTLMFYFLSTWKTVELTVKLPLICDALLYSNTCNVTVMHELNINPL